ncbi:GNAT family N-acetyltransferase [uncultured Dokdonia sp.]|jgi:predicted GNAT family acetyltransferase|uniref:GNAT family N-acetyltransferase n=1 Tax=uncultured Dokdonia sp. TaxID=575653 RepID=UPI0030EDAEBC|tara:strand:+ start:4905 stop:5186 length:282 start_codon:yes stop_codon:yes gene_type:complete
MTIQHKEREDRGVFYIKGENGIISELTYSKDDNSIITIDHTETKIAQEGKGYASKLMAHAVAFARENSLKINPLCPFAEVQFDRNPEFKDVLA